MSAYLTDGYHREDVAAHAPVNERMAFIKRTYALLFAAVMALIAIEAFLIKTEIGHDVLKTIGGNPILLIGTLVLLIVSCFASHYLARSGASPMVQCLGLAMEVFVWSVLLLPAMYICSVTPAYQNVPLQAGILTLVVFGGLTAVVLVSKRDFSFLGKILFVLSLVALGVVICAIVTGGAMGLGLWFSAAMIALACGYILYDTSNMLHHHPTNAHFAAALELFSSVAFLFYYIVRLLMSLASSD